MARLFLKGDILKAALLALYCQQHPVPSYVILEGMTMGKSAISLWLSVSCIFMHIYEGVIPLNVAVSLCWGLNITKKKSCFSLKYGTVGCKWQQMQPKVSGWEITVGNWHYVNGSRLLTKSTALKDNDWVFNSSASPENSKPEYSLNGTVNLFNVFNLLTNYDDVTDNNIWSQKRPSIDFFFVANISNLKKKTWQWDVNHKVVQVKVMLIKDFLSAL